MLQGNIVFSNELHRRYADQGIVSVSLHPGTLDTELARHGSKLTQCLFVRVPRTAPPPTLLIDLCPNAHLQKPFLYPAPMGALTQLYAGTTPQGAQLGGQVRSSPDRVSRVLTHGCSILSRGHGRGVRERRRTTRSSAASCGLGWKKR